MADIDSLYENYIKAYRQSLYAIAKEEQRLSDEKVSLRNKVLNKYNGIQTRKTVSTANKLSAQMHSAKDSCNVLMKSDTSILQAAEYLAVGSVTSEKLKNLFFTNNNIPWIMPLLGHGNVYMESKDNSCRELGILFTLRALQQTAPGQLNVTVINPMFKADFSALNRLPCLNILTKQQEITNYVYATVNEIAKADELLLGRYNSIIELRKEAKQPVGELRLIVILDSPKTADEEYYDTLLTILNNGPRAGISVLYVNEIKSTQSISFFEKIKKLENTFSFEKRGDIWSAYGHILYGIEFIFEKLSREEELRITAEILESSKNLTSITLPFDEIENTDYMWQESAVKNLTFSLGKAGLDIITVCIGDEVLQAHNILISGAAGKGKSNLLEVMIHSLCTRYNPDELELYLLDFKDGLTFKPYAHNSTESWLPHAKVLCLETERDIGAAILNDLEKERQRRAFMFRSSGNGIHDYQSYRQQYPNQKLPRIVLVIDEYQKLFDINDDISSEASFLLENLVRQGRACAIHVILASQSITGTVGLLGKEERIYAQFPVRIALQNTVTESFSIFGTGNDAASKLQIRGEAIINTQYGNIDANQKFTVAYANPDKMLKLRQSFCENWNFSCIPIVFGRDDLVECSMFIPDIKRMIRAVDNGEVPRLPLGRRISSSQDILSVSFANEIGKNIAFLGSAENLQAMNVVPGKKNIAIGMVQGFGIALALQHPEGNARFILINGLADNIFRNSNMQRWLQLMERFGFPVEIISAKESAEWMVNFQEEIRENPSEDDIYIFGMGMDQCGNYEDMDLNGATAASAFQELLKLGNSGIHFICWWTNVNMYRSHLGFNGEGYIGTKILLRMDSDTSRDIMGPLTTWGIRENRALVHDSSDLNSDVVVIPPISVTSRVCGELEAADWYG